VQSSFDTPEYQLKEALTWTPPVCQVKILTKTKNRLHSYIRPVDGIMRLAPMIFADGFLSDHRAVKAQEIPWIFLVAVRPVLSYFYLYNRCCFVESSYLFSYR